MAILFEDWCTADGGTDLAGVVTLTPIGQQAAGTLTLAAVPQPITVAAGQFSETVTPGDYMVNVELTAGADEVLASTDTAAQRIAVADIDTPQRLRDLIGLGGPGQSPLAKLNELVTAWIEGVADNTYAPKWLPSITYDAGTLVMLPAPVNGPGTRNSNGTSRATFDATEQGLWTATGGTVSEEAVADAVTADIAGRDLVQRADPGIPVAKALSVEYLMALLGTRDELVWAIKQDGTVEISIAKIAGGRVQNVPAEGLSWVAEIDASGRIPEVCLDNAGQVPAWVLARWATRMGLTGSDPAVSSWPLDIVVVAGQSNATQRSTLSATVEPSTDSVVEWNGSTFVSAAGVPWLGSGFARDYAAMHGRPRRRRVAIVKAALGSTGFSSLDPGTWDRTVTTGATAYLYPEMIAKAQAALAAAPAGSQIVAMLWSQGEQDRTIAATTYQAKLDDLIAQTRIDLGIPDLPVIVGSVSPDWIKYLESQSSPDYRGAAINNILEDTPRRLARTAFVPGPASMSEPETGIHWTPQGQALRGIAMARVGLDTALLNLATSAPMPPQNLRVTRSGTEVVVEWDHPVTRITSYTIQVSTDLGAVWTAMTLDRPTAHKVTGSVAVGTPVWVRGTGTNEVGTSMLSREVHA
ncbi:minor tail protein [Gordonia phage BBQValindra]|nr:minor tail protein [Gordonia phage BBQValindra]